MEMRIKMLKRITALVLSLCMVMALTSCWKWKKEANQGDASQSVEKNYASQQAMDLYETLDAIRQLKDKSFELQINEADPKTGNPTRTLMTISGTSLESSRQAELHFQLKGQPFTTVLVSGGTLLLAAKDASDCLSDSFGQLMGMDEEEQSFLTEELSDIAAQLPEGYVSFRLEEDLWDSRESGSLSAGRVLLEQTLEEERAGLLSQTQTGEESCLLELEGEQLRKRLLPLAQCLNGEREIHKKGITGVLEDGFAAVLKAYGSSPSDWFETKWGKYDLLHTALEEENGAWTGWKMRVVTCGDAASGYTIDLTDLRETPRNYCLSVYPTQEKLKEAPQGVPSEDAAEPLAILYADFEIYRNYLKEEGKLVSSEYQFGEGGEGLLEMGQLVTAPINGRPNLRSTVIYTEDGCQVTLPVPAVYQEAEVELSENLVTDIFLSSNGYVMEYCNLLQRSVKSQVQDNLDIYEDTFCQEQGYSRTQASAVVTNSSGSIAVGGMSYYDEEQKQDVTILTGSIAVPDSDYSIGFDLFLYSRSVTGEEAEAVEAMMEHLGVRCPVEIIKN